MKALIFLWSILVCVAYGEEVELIKIEMQKNHTELCQASPVQDEKLRYCGLYQGSSFSNLQTHAAAIYTS